MYIDGCLLHWSEQCDCCKNDKCKYREDVQNYIRELYMVDDKGCHGSLSFVCDYFIFDKKKYKENCTTEFYSEKP